MNDATPLSLPTAELSGPSLAAWTAHALGYQGLAFHDAHGQGLMSPDPDEPGCAFDSHDYLRGDTPDHRLWNWWLGVLAPGDALQVVNQPVGARFRLALGERAWHGATLSEALCRALVAHRLGDRVSTRYPWGHAMYPSDPRVVEAC